MGGAEKFCLRWNDFESNVSSAFRELRDEKDFFDVTLACDDEQIHAHKVILGACSSFFRSVRNGGRQCCGSEIIFSGSDFSGIF